MIALPSDLPVSSIELSTATEIRGIELVQSEDFSILDLIHSKYFIGGTMPVSNPTAARILVHNVVVAWLKAKTGSNIKIDRMFTSAPPDGYGMTKGAFFSMCDDITDTLTTASGRALTLPARWRLQHLDDIIADFINAVALRLVASASTAIGKAGLRWAGTN